MRKLRQQLNDALALVGVGQGVGQMSGSEVMSRFAGRWVFAGDVAERQARIDAIEAINAELVAPAPAIMISSDYSAQLREQLDQLDIPLLTKPVDPARLRAVMQHLLGNKALAGKS